MHTNGLTHSHTHTHTHTCTRTHTHTHTHTHYQAKHMYRNAHALNHSSQLSQLTKLEIRSDTSAFPILSINGTMEGTKMATGYSIWEVAHTKLFTSSS